MKLKIYKLESYSELPIIQGIYFIINTVNNKYYLGRALNIKERYSWKDIEYSHHNYLLRDSIKEYGKENFIVFITEYPDISLQELINIEQGLLDTHYGNGLCINLSPLANGGSIPGEKWYNNGIKNKRLSPDEDIPEGYIIGMKEETRLKFSEVKKGDKNPCYGKLLYNNGIENKYFSPDEEIPEGFMLGNLFYNRLKKELLKQEKCNKRKIGEELKIGERISIILDSGIDYTSFGWVAKLSNLLGISHTQVRRFIKKYIPDFYINNNCFVRKHN